MKLKDKLILYIYHKGTEIEQEERDLKTSLRLSALDNLDHYEILLHRIRLQAFNEFVDDLYTLVFSSKSKTQKITLSKNNSFPPNYTKY